MLSFCWKGQYLKITEPKTFCILDFSLEKSRLQNFDSMNRNPHQSQHWRGITAFATHFMTGMSGPLRSFSHTYSRTVLGSKKVPSKNVKTSKHVHDLMHSFNTFDLAEMIWAKGTTTMIFVTKPEANNTYVSGIIVANVSFEAGLGMGYCTWKIAICGDIRSDTNFRFQVSAHRLFWNVFSNMNLSIGKWTRWMIFCRINNSALCVVIICRFEGAGWSWGHGRWGASGCCVASGLPRIRFRHFILEMWEDDFSYFHEDFEHSEGRGIQSVTEESDMSVMRPARQHIAMCLEIWQRCWVIVTQVEEKVLQRQATNQSASTDNDKASVAMVGQGCLSGEFLRLIAKKMARDVNLSWGSYLLNQMRTNTAPKEDMMWNDIRHELISNDVN